MRPSRLTACLRALLATCAAIGVPAAAMAAAPPPLSGRTPTLLSIPPQPLFSALMALGRQADVQILTSSGTLAGQRSAGTSGLLGVESALTHLLAGTGLEYEVVDARTVVVRQPDFIPALSYRSRLSDSKPGIPIVSVLDTIQVPGLRLGDAGFMANIARGATRSDTDLADLPLSASVITRDLIDSRQAFEVADVVRHVAGVDYVDGFGGPPLFRIRGFNTGNGLTDGMPNGVARIEDLPPLIGIERIEVLKGPETILGESSVDNNFGGSVNIVMKRPQADPVRRLMISSGRHDGVRLGADLAGALDAEGRLVYRLVAAGNRAGRTAQGYHGQRSAYLAPSIAWQGRDTQWLFGLEYVDNRLPTPDHTALLGPSLTDRPSFGLLLGNPDDHARYRTRRAFYMLDQALGERWTLHSRGQYVDQLGTGQDWRFSDTRRLGLSAATARSYRYTDTFQTLQNELSASFGEGLLVHDLLLGIDYARTRVDSASSSGILVLGNLVQNANALPSNLHLPPASSVGAELMRARPSTGSWSNHTGLFVQDQLSIGESWNVLATLRHASYALHGGNLPSRRQSKWVPRLGVVYKPVPSLSLYASSNTGFQVDALLGEDGRPLPPSVSRQIEAGVRWKLFDERARLSAAWYRIRLNHGLARISPEPPHFATPGPGQVSRGVEIEFEGQPLPGLDLSASYTGAHVRNRDHSTPYATPRHQGSLWASYRFQREAWHAWSVAGGVFARSRSMGQIEDGGHFALPGQSSAEANISRDVGAWSITLGVKNLFGHTLYAVNAESSFLPLREGREILLSGSYDF